MPEGGKCKSNDNMQSCHSSDMRISHINSESQKNAGKKPVLHTGIIGSSHYIISATTAMGLLIQKPRSTVFKITDVSRLTHSRSG